MDYNLKIVKETTIQASPASVWDALINPEKIKVYLFGTDVQSGWKKGDPILFTGTWNGTAYEDRGVIQEIESETILQYTYRSSFSSLPDGPENYSMITIRLEPGEAGVRCILEQAGFESTEAMEHSRNSWEEVLKNLRRVVMEGGG